MLIFNCHCFSVAADTCVAMDQWVQYPTAHTALDHVLPCVDKMTAQETLVRSNEVTHDLVNLVNEVITNVSNINFSPNFKPMYYNQSGPLVPLLCNPFYPDLTDRPCSINEVDLYNATQVYVIAAPNLNLLLSSRGLYILYTVKSL